MAINVRKLTPGRIGKVALRFVLLQAGAVLAAVGLEEFLVPNHIIDGGITGISIVLNYVTRIPLGIFLAVLNLPFLVLGFRQIGKSFVVSSIYSVLSLSVWVSVFHPIPEITHDLFLAAIFGGITLGLGVGLVIRNGGSLDGTEVVAISLTKKVNFTVGEIVMFFNVFILGSAGLILGVDKAMYSMVAYFVAYKMIDIVNEGLDASKSAFIVTAKQREVSKALLAKFKTGLTVLEARGGFSEKKTKVLYMIIRRLEIAKLKATVHDIDEHAFISIHDVHGVFGKNVEKR